MYINGLTPEEIKIVLEKEGFPAYKTKQIFQWVHKKQLWNFSLMTNLSKQDREKLAQLFQFTKIEVKKTKKSFDGTKKYLLELEDGLCIEAVLLKDSNKRKTVCISTQVGCALGCVICATAKMGFKRDLTCAEIIAQIELLYKENSGFENIVFMGMGEPFLNYDNVLKSILILNDKNGLNIGARKITISTAGLPKMIMALANFNAQVRLAVSINSADHYKRSEIMPINKQYPLEEVIEAVKKYISVTKRRVTFEYVLLKDFNDQEEDAYALIDLCQGMKVNINLIPANSPPPPFEPSPLKTQKIFLKILQDNKINAVLRMSKGEQIKAGCGQLGKAI
ncbi:23S rRNA (adenine(2503)-C(2))-methyltransferase [candidate division WOR-1 bacterium RIFOXYB2_FULL_42_35]|uniref:Probable dual-specificity RNA methyltransferase RlmN n=1 Tax=candidate division WOR-1 bacterium RIFOXYC2_FULL_41_25 TaxID=1802586 RepID=A0A1F4TJT0_UNCSA|nr:MAG: 23S rRNA (adenine(2503)-C(2))-methyltransferase [candidate division WOR-1 bacterium RIFOXYA2_FULL_41_14]OGC21678.1 MAG: 23S rRNA (adenine(2503)-C(2))-methyltransferase [candidate division WOR-1 bacterium RIFOXYB2_FULL_42_35]OGC32857.1 MAG: 23S rRNA (adenine(2503)-C(2))-methyltransferase [candidate division WOR-1 bacterium RIFOXYC2_FULL_41_25]OGC42865.1 MAG: 23S rRNA (adenine(2503)-C(2))-methyltransferase [candidate division WOR-1 bacterium RIFOXYD2_FULL_41_8]